MDPTTVVVNGTQIKCPHCGDEKCRPTHQGYTFCHACKRLGYETKKEKDGTITVFLSSFVPAPTIVIGPAPA